VTLAYELDGPPGAPVLVLSGGLGTTTAMWEPQLQALTRRFRVLRHDLPGHGRSPLPERPFSVADIGRGVVALLDEIGAERASFCGISLGGMVGMWLGAEAAPRIDRLVLACTGASLGTPEQYAARAAHVRAEGTRVTVEGARERWFTPAFRDSERARSILADLAGIPAEGYAACCEAVGAFAFADRLHEIHAPVLVVVGREDVMTPPGVVETLRSGIAGSECVEIPGAAHLASVEQPDAFTAAVLRHVDERIAA